jgi:putative membrane protein
MMYWWNGTGGWWMWLIMIVFWGAVIALIVWGIKHFSERSGGAGNSNAIDIAKQRYAKGEISHEEFEKIKKTLS